MGMQMPMPIFVLMERPVFLGVWVGRVLEEALLGRRVEDVVVGVEVTEAEVSVVVRVEAALVLLCDKVVVEFGSMPGSGVAKEPLFCRFARLSRRVNGSDIAIIGGFCCSSGCSDRPGSHCFQWLLCGVMRI